MVLLALYWAALIACYFIASRLRDKKEKFAFLGTLLNIVIYVLVFIMGLRMGANKEVTSNLGTIGLQSLVVSAFVITGSMLAVFFVRKMMGLNKQGVPLAENTTASTAKDSEDIVQGETDEQESSSGLKATLVILGCVAVGMLLGYFAIPKLFDDVNVFQAMSGDWLVVGIVILLACVGFDLGLDGSIFNSFKTVGIKVVFVPVAAVLGSLIMGVIYGFVSSFSIGEALAISAGFGWYTMAPGLIAESGFMVAGAVSFMHNVIRETFGIIAIPFLAKEFGYLESTAVPGVAAMDICMPIVERSCRAETVVYSFCTGALMALMVPIIVPIALTFA